MTPEKTAAREADIELERYELHEGPRYRFTPGRRDFFKLMGGGLALFLLRDEAVVRAQESGRQRRRRGGEELPQELAAWLHVGEDGTVTVCAGKAEVGQNVRTSLTQGVAEELRCPPALVRMQLADTDLTPYDMGTFGSRSTPQMLPQIRKVAAAARELLTDLAAARWQVARGGLRVEGGAVQDPASGAKLSFAELARGQRLSRTIAADAPLTPPPAWQVAGRSIEKVDARAMVTGRHKYTSDLSRPGMLCGRVLRPERPGARLVSADTSQVPAQLAGRPVQVVRDGDFLGVVAADASVAAQAAEAIRPAWKGEPQPSSKGLFTYLKANPAGEPKPSPGAATPAEIDAALQGSAKRLEARYTVAYIAHVPLEPRAALAEWSQGRLTVWTGTQVPFGVRSELAEAFGLPEDRVRVIVPDTGSGYGGKHTGECALEAARLARAAGKPVKLVWTREEEFTWAYARPAGLIEIRSGLDKSGRLTAWEFHNHNAGPSGIATPYTTARQRVLFHPARSPLRQGSYRGLAATANHFARESHMDDLAQLAGADPLEFRLRHLTEPRLKAVLEAAASRFGWGKRRTASGLACGTEKGGFVACCAEISTDGGGPRPDRVRVTRVVIAFECGAIVNPRHLANQVEGAVVMAIGGALFEALDFADGRVKNARLSGYRVPRFGDVPEIETVLLDRKDLPSAGAGETPIVGLAPAVGNAVRAATGVRVRALPMLPALAGEPPE